MRTRMVLSCSTHLFDQSVAALALSLFAVATATIVWLATEQLFCQFIRQIAKFNTLAKLTHAKYGTIIPPATFEQRKNTTVVAAIASQSTTISTNAQPG